MNEIDKLIDEMMPKIKEEKDPDFFTRKQFEKRKRKKKIARRSRRKNKRR